MPLSESPPENPGAGIDEFEDLYENAPCGYVSISSDGRIALVNRRITRWTGYAKADLLGRKFHDLLSISARIFYETNISPLLRMQGFVDEVAIDLVTAERTEIQCLMNASERRDKDGKLLSTRFAIFRASERRRYERALVESRDASERDVAAERETSELREQFIAVLGHDLRNPLASISSGTRLLSGETLSAKGKHILTLMQGSVIRASEMIDNVLDFARGRLGGGITLTREAAEPITPVLEQVIAELVSVSPEREIRTDFDLSQPVDCDRVRIGQLLSNLLGNAITHGAKDKPIIVHAQTEEGMFRLAVANGGHPIDEAAMERLFQPFFRGEVRANQLGLGLGLHIASQIAKAHGGTLTVTSNTDETRFTFAMPLQHEGGESV